VTADNLYKSLDRIYERVNTVCCDVAALNVKVDELRADVQSSASIPPRLAAIEARVRSNENEIGSIRARWWAVTLTAFGAVLASIGSIIVSVVFGGSK